VQLYRTSTNRLEVGIRGYKGAVPILPRLFIFANIGEYSACRSIAKKALSKDPHPKGKALWRNKGRSGCVDPTKILLTDLKTLR